MNIKETDNRDVNVDELVKFQSQAQRIYAVTQTDKGIVALAATLRGGLIVEYKTRKGDFETFEFIQCYAAVEKYNQCRNMLE